MGEKIYYLGWGQSQLDTHYLASETTWQSRIQLLLQVDWMLLWYLWSRKISSRQLNFQTSDSLFNWCTPDIISKWKWDEMKAPRLILFKIFLLCMGWFNESDNSLVCSTWGSIAQNDGVEFFQKRVRTSPIFLFFTMDFRSALNVRLLPEYAQRL